MFRICKYFNKSSQIFLLACSIFLIWKLINLNKGYEPASYLNSQYDDQYKDAKTILLYTTNNGDRENWRWAFPNRIMKCRNNVVCRVTSDHEKLSGASAVVVALSDINRFTWTWMPINYKSPPFQKWVAFWGEAPWFFYEWTSFTDISAFRVLNGIFDWTVSYRQDSTIISNYLHDDKKGSYCRYVKKKTPTKLDANAIMSKKSDLALWVVSHCETSSKREKFIEILSDIIPVTSLGSCTELGKDPSAFSMIDWYKFYFAFENSLCDDYITEKFFNMLKHNIVPVVLGAPKKDYEAIAPPNSFIHLDDFKTPQELAEYLTYLDGNQQEYLKYLEWKEKYELVCDEPWACKLCAKLYQQDDNTSKILDFPGYWNKSKCYGDWQHKTLSKQ